MTATLCVVDALRMTATQSVAVETRPEWEVRLVHRLDARGRVLTRTEPVRALADAQVVA